MGKKVNKSSLVMLFFFFFFFAIHLLADKSLEKDVSLCPQWLLEVPSFTDQRWLGSGRNRCWMQIPKEEMKEEQESGAKQSQSEILLPSVNTSSIDTREAEKQCKAVDKASKNKQVHPTYEWTWAANQKNVSSNEETEAWEQPSERRTGTKFTTVKVEIDCFMQCIYIMLATSQSRHFCCTYTQNLLQTPALLQDTGIHKPGYNQSIAVEQSRSFHKKHAARKTSAAVRQVLWWCVIFEIWGGVSRCLRGTQNLAAFPKWNAVLPT